MSKVNSQNRLSDRRVVLACGANRSGAWGTPGESIARLPRMLVRHGIRVLAQSPIYRTAPVGRRRQPEFLNAVIVVDPVCGPVRLLLLLKQLEAAAGRRKGTFWGPRALDIDIIGFRRVRLGWSPLGRDRQRPWLVVPHPEMHRRAFVLVPLAAVAPDWRHLVLGLSARQLLARLGPRGRVGISRTQMRWGPSPEKSR